MDGVLCQSVGGSVSATGGRKGELLVRGRRKLGSIFFLNFMLGLVGALAVGASGNALASGNV